MEYLQSCDDLPAGVDQNNVPACRNCQEVPTGTKPHLPHISQIDIVYLRYPA